MIFQEGELLPDSTISKMEIVQPEGNRQVERERVFYSLDAIISVGYRVNSRRESFSIEMDFARFDFFYTASAKKRNFLNNFASYMWT